MPKRNANIRTIADFNATENDSPNVRSIANQQSSSYEGMANNNNNNDNFNSNNGPTKLSGAASISTSSMTTTPNVYHIPRLHNDTYAKQLLHRVVQEFLPILQRRQYNVVSISELCCCNDGLDFQHELDNTHGNTDTVYQPPKAKVKRRGRKIRKVADNIWGYNRTTFSYDNHRKQHTIHIRLRHTNDHSKFLLYEDVAGTLAHELSHCEHGPHDAKFFKLMDDILEEHANLMYNRLATTKTAVATGTTPFSGTGQKLGSGIRPRFDDDDDGTNTNTAAAAMGTQGQVLGGDRTFVQWMSPKDAAVIAAETRRRQQLLRLRGDHDCCRPCYDDDDNDDIDNDNDDIETNIKSDTIVVDTTTGFHNEVDRDAAVKNEIVGSGFGVVNLIDLTELDDDTYVDECYKDMNPWNCHCCTYRNQPLSLVCDMCSTTRQISR